MADWWRAPVCTEIDLPEVLELLGAIGAAGCDVIETNHLYTFAGKRAYSLGE